MADELRSKIEAIERSIEIGRLIRRERLSDPDIAYPGIVITDLSGAVFWADETALEMFGYAIEEMTALRVEDLMPAAYRARHHVAMEHAIEAGDTRLKGKLEGIGVRKDGKEFKVKVQPMIRDIPEIGRLVITRLIPQLNVDDSALVDIESQRRKP